jgi:hypothetical protein
MNYSIDWDGPGETERTVMGKYALVRQATGKVLARSDDYDRLSRIANRHRGDDTEIVIYDAATEEMLLNSRRS